MNRNSLTTLGVTLVALILLAIPWRTSVEAPALLKTSQQANLYTPAGGRLAEVLVQPGEQLQAGQPLFRLEAPDLRHELDSVERRILILQWQSSFQLLDSASAAGLGVVRQELEAALQRRTVLREQWQALTVRAPFAGQLREYPDTLQAGQWLPAGELLGTLVDSRSATLEAFIEERDLARLAPQDQGWFYPESITHAARPLRLEHVAQTAVRELGSAPELASPYDGALAASLDGQGQARPEQALYRAQLQVTDGLPGPKSVLRGTVVLEGQRQSLLLRGWRNLMAVLIRESAF